MGFKEMWSTAWKVGEAKKAAPNDGYQGGIDPHLKGKKWKHLSGAEKAQYIGAHVGLATAMLPLAAIAVVSWPVSVPLLWGIHRSSKHPASAGAPATLSMIAMLAVAPAITGLGYERLARWRDKKAREGAKRDAISALSPEQLALIQAAEEGNVGAVKKALEAGADPNTKDHLGAHALYLACRVGSFGVARELLAAKADPNATSGDGLSALAVCAKSNSMACAKMLVDAGASLQTSHRAFPSFEDYARNFVSEGWIAGVKQQAALRDGAAPAPVKSESEELASMLRAGAARVGPGQRR